MEPKKDVSTAILDQKKAPNKLMVFSFSNIGWRSSQRWELIYSALTSKDELTQDLQRRCNFDQRKEKKRDFGRRSHWQQTRRRKNQNEQNHQKESQSTSRRYRSNQTCRWCPKPYKDSCPSSWRHNWRNLRKSQPNIFNSLLQGCIQASKERRPFYC